MKLWERALARPAETRSLPTWGWGELLPGLGLPTTWSTGDEERIGHQFTEYVTQAYQANGVVYGAVAARVALFSEVEFKFQQLADRRLIGGRELRLLEQPWEGATTGKLATLAEVDVSTAGNFFAARREDGMLERLRPDWVTILSEVTPSGRRKVIGYAYAESGVFANPDGAETFLPSDVCHYAPMPDPLSPVRGMSWITPVVREVAGDTAMSKHKNKFFTNAATPNMILKYPQRLQEEVKKDLRQQLSSRNEGWQAAYKTMVLDSGADPMVVGSNFEQIAFSATQAAGENRIAVASGVPASVLGIKEGLQGSALNAGNYTASFRRFADLWARPAWRDFAASLSPLIVVPDGTRLWYDDRHIAALQQDAQDEAKIRQVDAQTIRALTDAGYDPDAAVDFVRTGDARVLTGKHSGLFSVQLNPPDSGQDTE